MTDFRPVGRAPASRTRVGAAAIVAALAFLVGIGAAAWLASLRPQWFGRTGAVSPEPLAATPDPTPLPTAAPAASTGTSGALPPPPATTNAPADPATLASREQVLAAQLAALEVRTAAVSADAAAASGQAGRAEAMLVAFAARRAIDRGVGLGSIEAQLKARFLATQPQATATVVRSARAPVTLETLRQGLDAVAGDLVTRGGFLGSLRQELGALIVVHRAGTPSPLPADRLARARRLLDAGQVEPALAEVARLPGADQAGNWTAAARRWVDAHHALDTLETAAVMGQVAAVAPPAPAPVSAPAVPAAR
jgi:hypothetical protein